MSGAAVRRAWRLPARAGLVVLLFCALAAGSALADGEPVTVQLRWLHQFQFAGYYAALELGYYREAGLDVTLAEGGPGRNPIEEVLSGRAQYGAASSELLLARLRGKPVTVLAVIFQQSPSVFLARKISGISSPQDMLGQRVMMMPGMDDAELLAMFMKEGVKLDKIHRLPTSYDIDDLISGKTDVFNAYLTNEPYYLEKRGMPATVIRPSTYGIHFYGDCVFTSEGETKAHPERVKAFLQATLRGWQYAMDNPEEIIELILQKYHAKKTREHLRYEATAMRELMQPEMIQIGHMNPGRWRHMADTFAELGLVSKDFKLKGLTYDPEAQRDLTPFLWVAGGAGGVLLVVGSVAVFLARFNRRLRREVDERTRAEQRFAAMVANVPGVIFQMHVFADGRREYVYLSPGAEEFFGLAPEEVIRRKGLLPWHPDDRSRIEREALASAASGGSLNLVGRILPPGGLVKWVQINASSAEVAGGPHLATGFILDITKRKLAEMEYLASERMVKAMSQAVDDALIMLDSQGMVLFWNPAAERLFGYSAREAMGMDFHDMAAPEVYREKARQGLTSFARDGLGPVLGTTTEIEAQDRHGRVFPVEVTLSSFQMDDKWFAVGTVRDISARKRSEEAIRESERRLADIIDFLPDPTLVVDNEGGVVSWNRSMERLTGVKKEDILGKGDHEYSLPFYGERRPILVDLVSSWNDELAREYLSIEWEGECLISESHHAHLGEGGVYLSGMASVLYDASGKKTGAIETLRDITERKKAEALMVEKEVAEEAAARAERARQEAEAARAQIEQYKGRLELLVAERTEELRASEERSRLLLHSVGEGIFGVNAQGVLTFINPAALKMLGFSEDELMDQPVHARIHHSRAGGGAYPEDGCPMRASFAGGVAQHVEDEVLWRKDGQPFPVEYSSTPIRQNGRVMGAVITFRDISERRRAEEEMRQYVDDLERFNRLTLGREERMIELKEEINGLLDKMGQERKYRIVDQAGPQ